MKKIFYTFCLLFLASFAFVSCDKDESVPNADNISTSNEGVTINGVRWATRNVNSFGTFAANPEDFGMFYQWSRTQAWASSGLVSGWNSVAPPFDGETAVVTWASDLDPCPAGWRVPTGVDLRSLAAAGSVWATRNGVNGHLFGTAPNQIFLPAAGVRGNTGTGGLTLGGLLDQGNNGFYVGRERLMDNVNKPMMNVWALGFNSHASHVSSGGAPPAAGYSIRCVAQ
jgi:hypothetical protein